MKISRRDLLGGMGGLVLGLGLGGVGAGIANGIAAETQPGAAELPWPYKKLDPDAAAERAYEGYYKGACCFGGFDGVVGDSERKWERRIRLFRRR